METGIKSCEAEFSIIKGFRLGSERPGAWLLRPGFSNQDPVPTKDYDSFCQDLGCYRINLGLELKVFIILDSV